MTLREECLLKLQEVLRVKNYSSSVKQKIRTVLLEICELDIENKREKILSIIKGLKSIDTFEFDTREQLMKHDYVKNYLSEDMGGFVHIPSHLAVIVKDEQDDETVCHELFHLSQNENSYQLDSKYGFSELVRKAMIEGEAIFHELKFSERRFPKTYTAFPGIQLTLFSCHTKDYKIFLEFYQDMKNVLGESLIQKWKEGNYEGDIMLEFDDHMQKHYNCSFSSFYNLWKGILYHVCKDEEYIAKMAYSDLKRQEKNYQEHIMESQNLELAENRHHSYIDSLNSELLEINNKLNNHQLLEENFLKEIELVKEELNEYLREYGEDEYAIELKEEMEHATIDDYRDSLICAKIEREDLLKEAKIKSDEMVLKKVKLNWIKRFDCSISDVDIETLAIGKQLFIDRFKHNSRELEQANFLSNSLYYYGNNNSEDKTISSLKGI